MKVSSVEVLEPRWPLRAPLETARGTVRERRGFVLRLTGDSGTVGLGEASPADWVGGESLDAARAALETLSRRLSGGATIAAWSEAARSPGLARSAAFALETALLDLDARSRGVSAAALLALGRGGGEPAARVEAARLLAAAEPRDAAREAAAAVRRGFLRLKLKVGAGSIAGDLERIAAVRGVLPAAARLRLDANRAWTADDAERAFAALSSEPVEFVEEPLAAPKAAALRALRRGHGLRVALDESIEAPDDLQRMAEDEALDVLVVKAARLGGLRDALALADRARSHGIEVVVTDSLEGPVGMAAAVALAAVVPEPRLPLGLAGASLIEDAAVPEFLRAPEIIVPRLGLGVSLTAGRTTEERPNG